MYANPVDKLDGKNFKNWSILFWHIRNKMFETSFSKIVFQFKSTQNNTNNGKGIKEKMR